jgi:hypothetical protein
VVGRRSHRPLQHVPFHTLSVLEHRKDPFGATFGTDKLPCRSARPHVFMLILLFSSCSSFFFFLSCVLLTASRSTTRHPSSCGTRQDTCSIHVPSRSRPLPSSTFLSLTPLLSLPWTTLTNSNCHYAAATHPRFLRIIVFPLLLAPSQFNLHRRHPQVALPYKT